MLVGRGLKKTFAIERDLVGRVIKSITAVDDVSVEVEPSRTLAVVGESGCGKSTMADLMLLLQRPDAGSVSLDGEDLVKAPAKRLRGVRSELQAVFQDPYSSLDPSQTIGSALLEPLKIHKVPGSVSDLEDRIISVLERVGIGSSRTVFERYPSEFSGGQRQRIAIARALVLEPRYVILDEAVSALDVSTQAQIMDLLEQLQEEHGLGYLFISHDLGVVRHLADEIAVMYLGRVVEKASVLSFYARPRHPYSAGLLASVPKPDPKLQKERVEPVVGGEPPDPAQRPGGCAFHPRCPYAQALCTVERPETRRVGGVEVACHFADDLDFTAKVAQGKTA